MSRTILDPEYANSLSGLFNGETPINVASVNVGVSPSNVVLSTNAPGSLLVGGTITTSGGLTAQNGNLTLGTSPASVALTGTTGTLTVTGTVNANALGVTNGANAVSLQCLSPAVLTVGGSCIASSFSAPYYGGGLYAGLYSTPVSVPANSAYPITIGSIPYNPISGWVPSSIFPQFTINSSLGGITPQSIVLTKNGDNTLTIDLTVYNSNPSNAQTLTSFYWLLFYQ